MDKLTDVLTTFFVNKKTNTYIDTHATQQTTHHKVSEQDESNLYVSQNIVPDSSETNTTIKSKMSINKQKSESSKDESSLSEQKFEEKKLSSKSVSSESVSSESVSNESVSSESVSNESVSSESVSSASISSESVSSESVSSESVSSESVSNESVSNESVSSESVSSESVSSESVSTISSLSKTNDKSLETSKSSKISYLTETVIYKKEKDYSVKEKNETKDKEVIKDVIKEVIKEVDNGEYKLEKYSLNSVDLYNKNILIINEYKKDNIEILNNILYKLNLLKNISTIYANNIRIVTSNENKKVYKKILLDNPYLYFINFDFKQEINNEFLESCQNIQKRTVVIIDVNLSDENNEMIKIMSNNKNIQLILLSSLKNTEILNLYDLIGDNKLLIHKINKLKSIQKQFYKMLKPLCTNAFDDFDNYYNSLNNETLDVKYIIFKNLELKYN